MQSSLETRAPGAPRARVSAVRRREPTGVERVLGADELIVSKTDTSGRITYVNRTFLRISGFTEAELLGTPHSIVRHPAMPRGTFRLMWDTIRSGREFFAYVLNLAKTGDHYWVFAHVTPTFDPGGEVVGYHSNRRAVTREAIDRIEPLYRRLVDLEATHADPGEAADASLEALSRELAAAGTTYDRFVFSLAEERT